MTFLNVSGVSRTEGNQPVVDHVSYIQQQFQQLAIAGETGSGKSTLLKMVAGLVQPNAGEVLFQGQRVKGPAEKLIPGHPGIAYLSQHFELRNNYRVEEILSYANTFTEAEAGRLFEICRISHLLKRRTDQVSGGEKQRIAIARLLVSSPKLLLLDEPYSNLDMHHKNILQSVIHDIGEGLQITCALVSHDPQDVLSWADEVIIMKDGKIEQQGTPWEVYNRPVSVYSAGLFGKYSLIDVSTAQLFSLPRGYEGNGKAMFVRPENVRISENESGGIKAVVTRASFLGGFYDLELAVAGTKIIARTMNGEIAKGNTVYVSLQVNDMWRL